MTKSEKELLLTAICGYLHGLKIEWQDIENNVHISEIETLNLFLMHVQFRGEHGELFGVPFETVKPYLRPMSSMTEEEEAEWHDVRHGMLFEEIDWLNRKKFDYRGLIPKGLGLIAPEGMYND